MPTKLDWILNLCRSSPLRYMLAPDWKFVVCERRSNDVNWILVVVIERDISTLQLPFISLPYPGRTSVECCIVHVHSP